MKVYRISWDTWNASQPLIEAFVRDDTPQKARERFRAAIIKMFYGKKEEDLSEGDKEDLENQRIVETKLQRGMTIKGRVKWI